MKLKIKLNFLQVVFLFWMKSLSTMRRKMDEISLNSSSSISDDVIRPYSSAAEISYNLSVKNIQNLRAFYEKYSRRVEEIELKKLKEEFSKVPSVEDLDFVTSLVRESNAPPKVWLDSKAKLILVSSQHFLKALPSEPLKEIKSLKKV